MAGPAVICTTPLISASPATYARPSIGEFRAIPTQVQGIETTFQYTGERIHSSRRTCQFHSLFELERDVKL